MSTALSSKNYSPDQSQGATIQQEETEGTEIIYDICNHYLCYLCFLLFKRSSRNG